MGIYFSHLFKYFKFVSMSISFNTVTRFSQIVAIILFIVVFAVGFYIGQYSVIPVPAVSTTITAHTPAVSTGPVVNAVTFACTQPAGSFISSIFYRDAVTISLSDGRTLTLPHALSADGARYANADESFVFWNKGNTAFVTENGTTTWSGCVVK